MKKVLYFLFFISTFSAFSQDLLTGMPVTNDEVKAILRIDNTVYIAGKFDTVNGQYRSKLASFDATTGALSNWAPNPDDDVYALAIVAGKLAVSGSFSNIDGQARGGLCLFNLPLLTLSGWSPATTSTEGAIAVDGNLLYFGGYEQPNFVYRFHCLDAATETLTPWLSSYLNIAVVNALAVDSNYVYAGGDFIGVMGVQVINLCRFDISTGAIDATWNPVTSTSDFITCLGTKNSILYVGGSYTTIGGQSRKGISAFDSNGTITAFNPYCSNSQIWALFLNDPYIWIGGNSAVLGGDTRYRIAEIETFSSYFATCWDPTPHSTGWSWVNAIFVSGDTVYTNTKLPSFGNTYFNVFVNSPRPQPLIAGPTTVNANQSATYSVTNIAGNTYTWTITGGTGTSTTNSITVTWGTGVAGTVTVTEENNSLSHCVGTDSLNVTIGTVGINDVEAESFQLFPNPVSGLLTVSFDEAVSESSVLMIYDASGKKIFDKKVKTSGSRINVDVSGLPDGVYQLMITSDGKNYSKRVVKN